MVGNWIIIIMYIAIIASTARYLVKEFNMYQSNKSGADKD